MAADCSFDVVSQVEMPEAVNAVDQAMREIKQRFDFRGSISNIDLNQKENKFILLSEDEMKLKSVIDVLQSKLVKRGVPIQNLQYGKVEGASAGHARQEITIQQGIPQDKCKEIVATIKALKMKVQGSIQGDQVRVTGKSRDDLQTVIQELKKKDFGLELQFTNYR